MYLTTNKCKFVLFADDTCLAVAANNVDTFLVLCR